MAAVTLDADQSIDVAAVTLSAALDRLCLRHLFVGRYAANLLRSAHGGEPVAFFPEGHILFLVVDIEVRDVQNQLIDADDRFMHKKEVSFYFDAVCHLYLPIPLSPRKQDVATN